MKKFLMAVALAVCSIANILADECPNGTILFREDFGGNDPSDPEAKPTGIPQCSYNYNVCPLDYAGNGRYAIRKVGYQPHYEWYTPLDHTYPEDETRGYFMQCDASKDPCTFYYTQIDNVCENMQLYLSMWAMSCTQLTGYENAYLKLLVEDVDGNELASKDIVIENCKGYWEQFGLSFKVPAGNSSIIYKIVNNTTTDFGNDFCLDDIEIRYCSALPPVISATANSTCIGKPATLKADFENDGTLTEPLSYTWFKCNTPSYDFKDWTKIQTSDELTFSKVKASDSVYYRVMVSGKNGSTDLNNCSPISEIFKLNVESCGYDTTINATICDGDIYSKFGFEEDEEGSYMHSFTTNDGKDSILILNLKVAPSYEQTINATIKKGKTYKKNGFNESETGTYTQSLVTVNGCDSIITLNLEVKDLPTIYTNLEATICEGETYEENGFNESKTGTYTQSLVTANGNDSIVTLNLEVHAKPVIDEVEPEGDDYRIVYTANEAEQPYTLCVDDDCDASEVISGTNIGIHQIVLSNQYSCSVTKTFIVGCDIEPAPYFTPNNDGINDVWQIKNIKSLPDAVVKIFDRYGKLLVTYTNYDNATIAWDGIYNGNKMPSSDYWYIITSDNIDKTYTGHFTLIR